MTALGEARMLRRTGDQPGWYQKASSQPVVLFLPKECTFSHLELKKLKKIIPRTQEAQVLDDSTEIL